MSTVKCPKCESLIEVSSPGSTHAPLAALFFLFLILMNISWNRNVESVISLDTGEYEEKISYTVMITDPPEAQGVYLGITFTNLAIDTARFANEPSFVRLLVLGFLEPDYKRLSVTVTLDANVVSVLEGKIKAHILKTELGNLFNMALPYDENPINATSSNRVSYLYVMTEEFAQRFRDAFSEYLPSQGFGRLMPFALTDSYEIICVLERTGTSFKWTVQTSTTYRESFETTIGKEYNVSLKELMNYSGYIQSSAEASRSIVSMSVTFPVRQIDIVSIDTMPQQMTVNREKGGISARLSFEKDITGGSIEDLSIRFKIGPPNLFDLTIIAIVAGIAVALASCVVVFVIKRKSRHA